MKQIIDHLKLEWYKYVLEILVITIGILGAFALNNWNENNKSERQEYRILQSLHEEIIIDTAILIQCKKQIKERKAFTDSLRGHVGPEYPSITKQQFIRWAGYSFGDAERCVLPTDVLDELKSSGNLNQIQSVEIRRQISNLSAKLGAFYQIEDEWHYDLANLMLPYSNTRMSWEDVDHYFNPDDGNYLPTKFEYDPLLMLQELEFSNMVNNMRWRIRKTLRSLEEVEQSATELLELLRKEMNTFE